MHLYVEPGQDGVVELREADDFTSLKVVAAGPEDWTALADALRAAASLEPPHAWLGLEALAGLSGRGDDPAWRDGFAKMVDYARTQGWVNEAGSAVRAHVEWWDG
ncbi:MAG TPA: hypothetical protein VIL48_12080 [Acidimicrobiales bacterium]